MILPAQKGAARIAIHRFGESCSLTEPVDDDLVESGYGKRSEDSWTDAGTEPVVRIYQRGAAPSQSRVESGRYRTESPVLLFLPDSAIRSGFRVMYRSTSYEIDSLTVYPTHIEADTTVVN